MLHSEFIFCIFCIWCNEDNGNILLSCIWFFIKTNSFIHQFRLWSTATLNLQISHTFYGSGKLLSFFQWKGAASTLWIYWFVSSKPDINSFTHSSNRTSESHFLIFACCLSHNMNTRLSIKYLRIFYVAIVFTDCNCNFFL